MFMHAACFILNFFWVLYQVLLHVNMDSMNHSNQTSWHRRAQKWISRHLSRSRLVNFSNRLFRSRPHTIQIACSSGENKMVLPVELTDRICSYLEVEDLLNLSATNLFWRNAVNRDRIWKPLCKRYFNVDPFGKPLIGRKCRVKPPFKMVTNSSKNLSNICQWRIRFAQEVHVLKNWKNMRFDKEIFPKEDIMLFYVFGNFIVYDTSENDLIQVMKRTNDGFIRFIKMDPIEIFRQKSYEERYYNERNFTPLRSGFVYFSWPFIYYYKFDEDGFKLKIRTIATKALHPEVPSLTELSHIDTSLYPELQVYEGTDEYLFTTVINERYAIISRYEGESNVLFCVWDLQTCKTFSCIIQSEDKPNSRSDRFQRPSIFFPEGDSSIIFMTFSNLRNLGSVIYILKICNSKIDILHKHITMKPIRCMMQIVGNSLALLYEREIVFLHGDGSTRSIRCFDIVKIIDCRSFYVGQMHDTTTVPGKVVIIDKRDFSIKTISEKFFVKVKSFFKGCSLDLLLFSYEDDIHVEDTYFPLTNHFSEIDDGEIMELHDLKNSKIIPITNMKNRGIFHSISNNNKMVIINGNKLLHFW